MAMFSKNDLVKKLAELNLSQQSIQTLSLWLIHHRKHYQIIVKVWYKELVKAHENRKITFIYLANDIIQNSKKKGSEYGKEFGLVLPKALEHLSSITSLDEKSKSGLQRVIRVWEERGVYDAKQIAEFKAVLGNAEPASVSQKSGVSLALDEPPSKKSRTETEKPAKEKKLSETEADVDSSKDKDPVITLSPRSPAGEPPEPEEIIKALMDLENSASSDVAVREAIAHLPPEVTNADLLQSITDRSAAENLSKHVNAAVKLLTDYNGRLAAELEDRKKVTAMLKEFTHSQMLLLNQAKERLEEYQDKLQKVHQVRQEVRSHIQNLPDITQLPDVTGGLAPLPSAGDLFSFHA